jgi:hypothetical protein
VVAVAAPANADAQVHIVEVVMPDGSVRYITR